MGKWLALLAVAFALNVAWEFAQAPLYGGDGGPPTGYAEAMPTVATIGLSPLVQLPLTGAVSALRGLARAARVSLLRRLARAPTSAGPKAWRGRSS